MDVRRLFDVDDDEVVIPGFGARVEIGVQLRRPLHETLYRSDVGVFIGSGDVAPK